MRVAVFPERCVTAQRCSFTAPEVFTHNDDGVVELLADQPATEHHDAVRDAAYLCPARAINLRDD